MRSASLSPPTQTREARAGVDIAAFAQIERPGPTFPVASPSPPIQATEADAGGDGFSCRQIERQAKTVSACAVSAVPASRVFERVSPAGTAPPLHEQERKGSHRCRPCHAPCNEEPQAACQGLGCAVLSRPSRTCPLSGPIQAPKRGRAGQLVCRHASEGQDRAHSVAVRPNPGVRSGRRAGRLRSSATRKTKTDS